MRLALAKEHQVIMLSDLPHSLSLSQVIMEACTEIQPLSHWFFMKDC